VVEREFPKIVSLTDTVDALIRGASISRFGDGELMIILKYNLGFQVYSEKLAQRLSGILAYPTNEKVIVGLYPFRIGTPHETRLSNGFLYSEQFYATYWKRLRKILVLPEYGNPFVSRAAVFYEVPLEKIRSIWAQRDVVFVVGANSRFFLEPRLFDNIRSAEYIYVKAKNCFEDYDEILKQSLTHDKSKLFFISCGPTATVLAFDLAQQGYQAIDMGHLPNCYKHYLREADAPETTPLESI
jgi:glycosyltransferase family protein